MSAISGQWGELSEASNEIDMTISKMISSNKLFCLNNAILRARNFNWNDFF